MPIEIAAPARAPLVTAHQIAALPPSDAASDARSATVDASFLEARERTRRFTGPDWKPQASSPDFKPFGDDGLTFDDFIDVINPLQHIPVVGSIYRWLTGDTIAPVSRIAGAALFGGPIGLAGSIGSLIVEGITGAETDQAVLTAVLGPSPFADETPTDAAALAAAPATNPEAMLAPAAGAPTPDNPSAMPANLMPALPANALPALSPSAMPALPPTGQIELDPAAEAALLRFIARQPAPAGAAANRPVPPPVIDIAPSAIPGSDLPGSIPLDLSRAYDSYRRQQERSDGALAPEIELDIRS